MRKKTGFVDKNNFEKLYRDNRQLYQYIRYAFIYNAKTGEFDDSPEHDSIHQITNKMFFSGWCACYFLVSHRNWQDATENHIGEEAKRLICYIKGVSKEFVWKTYQMILSDFNNYIADRYVLLVDDGEKEYKTVFNMEGEKLPEDILEESDFERELLLNESYQNYSENDVIEATQYAERLLERLNLKFKPFKISWNEKLKAFSYGMKPIDFVVMYDEEHDDLMSFRNYGNLQVIVMNLYSYVVNGDFSKKNFKDFDYSYMFFDVLIHSLKKEILVSEIIHEYCHYLHFLRDKTSFEKEHDLLSDKISYYSSELEFFAFYRQILSLLKNRHFNNFSDAILFIDNTIKTEVPELNEFLNISDNREKMIEKLSDWWEQRLFESSFNPLKNDLYCLIEGYSETDYQLMKFLKR